MRDLDSERRGEPGRKQRQRWTSIIAVCALGLGLAGCTDGSAETAAPFDLSLEDKPCAIMPAALVSRIFSVPESELEQVHVISSQCSYEWEGDKKNLNAEVSVETFESVEKAAEDFRDATRSMSADEISEAMSKIKKQAEAAGDLDTDAKRDAAEKTGEGVAAGGLQFEDVDGVADRARLRTGDGRLYVLKGNLRLVVTAYYGPGMELPDEITTDSMTKAARQWQRETVPERRQQAVELAKGIIAAL